MPNRIVYTADAIDWLQSQPVQEGSSFIASLPDYSEFPALTLAEWKGWFTNTAALVLSRTPASGVTIFFQSDIKHEGTWIDKSYLVQKAAEHEGSELLFHKIFCRNAPGSVTCGRPAYSHLLAFSKGVRADVAKSTADVVEELGEKAWVRGMGIEACRIACRFIMNETSTRKLVNPFCGYGSALAVANEMGMSAVGVERSEKRATIARAIRVIGDDWDWKDQSSLTL